MSNQPKTLSQALGKIFTPSHRCGVTKRLQAERDELLEALRDMVSDHAELSAATLAFARAAIAKAEVKE